MSVRTYHDPLHLGITLNSCKPAEAMVMELIDSSPFQRLRRIRQLGPASLTFHGAESSRFTHSLGVFHLARKALDRLVQIDSDLNNYRGLLYAASLLHDIGHGPLSHTGEEMFGMCHEYWSGKLVKEDQAIKESLEKYKQGTANEVADLIMNGQVSRVIIKDLISSQLDCDRLDYLLRDSYSTGTRYGQLDLERIISALTIAPDKGLAIHPKGLLAVEHYLVVRNLMYRGVYNHRLNEVCSWILEKLITTARSLGPTEIWADRFMAQWLWNRNDIDIDTFLANDDIRTTYHLSRWKEEAPFPLSNLCERFLNRNLLKAVALKNLNNEQQLEALVIARKLTEANGLDPDFSCGVRHQQFHGYHPYKSGIRLWDGVNLQAIEHTSALIKALSNPDDVTWLIHPKEIHQELKKKLNSFNQAI